jgi:hypothetical protein
MWNEERGGEPRAQLDQGVEYDIKESRPARSPGGSRCRTRSRVGMVCVRPCAPASSRDPRHRRWVGRLQLACDVTGQLAVGVGATEFFGRRTRRMHHRHREDRKAQERVHTR